MSSTARTGWDTMPERKRERARALGPGPHDRLVKNAKSALLGCRLLRGRLLGRSLLGGRLLGGSLLRRGLLRRWLRHLAREHRVLEVLQRGDARDALRLHAHGFAGRWVAGETRGAIDPAELREARDRNVFAA